MFAVLALYLDSSIVSWPAVFNCIMLCSLMHKEANKSLEPINVAFVLESVAVVF